MSAAPKQMRPAGLIFSALRWLIGAKPAPALDRQPVPVPGEGAQDSKDANMGRERLLFEPFIAYCKHEIIPAGRMLLSYDKTDALAEKISRFGNMHELLPQVPHLRRHLVAVADSSPSLEHFLAWQIVLLQLNELYRRRQQEEQQLAGEGDKEVVAGSATGVRAQMAKEYLEYIETLGENQAGKLQANPDERIGTIRRRLNYAAKMAGKTLTIKGVGDELYFWVQPPQEGRPVRRRRVGHWEDDRGGG